MADQKKNDVADALAALAGGAVPSETESPSGGIPSETTVFSPPAPEQPISAPAAAPASGKRPTAIQPTQASASASAPPRPPVAAGSASSPDARTAPYRPGGTSPNLLPKDLPLPSAIPPPARIRPANPDGSAAKPRPAMPERPAAAPAREPAHVEEVPETIPEIIEDEETIAAAPDASAFAPRAVHKRPAHTPVYASLFFRRTIIPILLTCGVMLPCIGLWSMFDQNAPLAAIGRGVEVMLIVIGAVLLALGFINAMHVKNALQAAQKQTNS